MMIRKAYMKQMLCIDTIKKNISPVKRLFVFVAVVVVMNACFLPVSTYAAADSKGFVYDGYIYDHFGNVLETPSAFQLERVIDENNMGGVPLKGINDVDCSADGRIFLTDTLSGRVNVIDGDGNYITSIKAVKDKDGKMMLDKDGKQVVLKAPEGTFVHEKSNELYIADPEGAQIVVLDLTDYSYKRTLKKPANMTGSTQFKPSKVAVDDADRVFAIVQSSYEGIIEMASDGSFIGYYGVNPPKVNLVAHFWKSIATDAQKEQMTKTFAPAFNNIAVDGEGFVMAVTYDHAAADMVFRLNSKGENVLREEGVSKVRGDLLTEGKTSEFVDIAVTDFGTYALLDRTRGRVFIYDFDGNLLNVFGSLGDLKGEVKTPSGIAWLGDKLVVSDSTLSCAYIYKPTKFGNEMLRASDEYYNGNWDEALDYFNKAVALNANYEVAYSGIGKNYLMKDEFKKAMYYFKLGNNKVYYSKAYYGYRGEQLRKAFPLIAVVTVVLLVLLFGSEAGLFKRKKRSSQ